MSVLKKMHFQLKSCRLVNNRIVFFFNLVYVKDNHITHVINVSKAGQTVPFLDENDDEHFLRIPVNDCHSAQLSPYFQTTHRFIGNYKFLYKKFIFFFVFLFFTEKARLNNGHVLIHCLGFYFFPIHSFCLLSFSLAGISRSPTLAIAYIMCYLHLSADEAYQYVKQRRSQISPNFNFLGQLSQYEYNLSLTPESTSIDIPTVKCVTIETPLNDRRHFVQVEGCSAADNSIKYRTNAVSRPTCLSFDVNNNTTNLSVESSQQRNSLTLNVSRPKSISIKHSPLSVECSTLELINSSCDDSTKTKRLKSANTSSSIEQTDLINTYLQESKSLQQQSADVISETTTSPPTANALSSSLKLRVS